MSNPIRIRRLGIAPVAILGASLLLVAGNVCAAPKLVLSEDLWNFGNITATYPVGHVFKVKNSGDQPLVIEQVTAECGCTTPTLSQHTIDPGKEIPLGLVFDPATLAPGMSTQKSVTITSNDPAASAKVVSIKASLSYQGVAGVGIEPKWIQLEKREGRRAVWKRVVLTNQLAGAVGVKVLEAAGAVTEARLSKTRIPSNGRAELRLLVNGPKLARKGFNRPSTGHSVTLAITTERREENVTLPVATFNEDSKAHLTQ